MCTPCDLNRHSEHQKSVQQTRFREIFSSSVQMCPFFIFIFIFLESALCEAVGCCKRNGARFRPGQLGLGGPHPIPTFPRPHRNSQLSRSLGPAGSSTAPPVVCRRGAACSRMPRKLFGGALDTGRPRPLCQLWLLTSFCAVFIPQALSETWPGLSGYREDGRMYKKSPGNE